MRLEKHIAAIKEVDDEIESSLSDEGGLSTHQRRLAFMISLGIAELIEIYFHRLKIMKEGSRVKHEWLKKRKAKDHLSNQVTAPIDNISRINEILRISSIIEEKRNELAYSSPIDEESILKETINRYLDIKNIIEQEVGDIYEK